MYVEVLCKNIQRNIDHIIDKGLLSNDGLRKYFDYNVHSILQYCLIRVDVDLYPIPEYKVKLKVPIDRFKIDERFKQKKKKRYQKFIKVDVAYLKNSNILGVGEVFTPDEIHGVLKSEELPGGPWITPRHKIEHLITHNKPRFLIVVNVISTYPPWRDVKQRPLDEWEEAWIRFIEDVCKQQNVECSHIIIKNVRDIKYYSYIPS
jgi:hypothetical protein